MMATIRPFRGVRYDPQKIPDLSVVVSQPHDRVRYGLQDKYYALSPYNIVRIIKGKEQAGDEKRDNIYTRARETYRAWLRTGVLMRERAPAFYVLQQAFTLPDGSVRVRQGLIAALELTRFDEGVVLPHERTLSHSMVDRLSLLRATEANFGSVFMLYPGDRVGELLRAAVERQPGLELRELCEREVTQRFWAVTDPEVIAAVMEEMAPRRGLVIADGHHRYETSLMYRDEMRLKRVDAPPNTAFNYRLVALISMDDPGLVILPTHRLIHSYRWMSGAEVLERARRYFEVTQVAGRAALGAALTEAGPSRVCFGFHDGRSALLTLRDPTAVKRLVARRSPDWCGLDVTALHELLIERVLRISKDAVESQKNIAYLRDAQAGYAAVERGEAEFFILMNPTRIEQVRACTAAGERMPQKSTDFYPKVISGLVALPVGADERL